MFTIKKKRQAEYWLSQAYPVMLVIRTSDGKIRWMNVTNYLQRHGPDTRQIILEGEPFTALNVARLRDRVLEKKRLKSRLRSICDAGRLPTQTSLATM